MFSQRADWDLHNEMKGIKGAARDKFRSTGIIDYGIPFDAVVWSKPVGWAKLGDLANARTTSGWEDGRGNQKNGPARKQVREFKLY